MSKPKVYNKRRPREIPAWFGVYWTTDRVWKSVL